MYAIVHDIDGDIKVVDPDAHLHTDIDAACAAYKKQFFKKPADVAAIRRACKEYEDKIALIEQKAKRDREACESALRNALSE